MLKKIKDILIVTILSLFVVSIVVAGIITFNNRDLIFKYTQQFIDNNNNVATTLNDISNKLEANDSNAKIIDELSTKSLMVTINGVNDILDLSSSNVVISPKKLMTMYPNEITFSLPEGASLTIFDKTFTSEDNSVSIDIPKISKYVTYSGTLTYNGCNRIVTFKTAPDDLAEYTMINSIYNQYGHFYTTDFSTNYAIELDGQGNTVFYFYDQGSPMHDFKKTVGDDGKTYYTYYKDYKFVLLDDHYNYIKEIGLQPTPKLGNFTDLDCHDIILYNPDHYYVFGYVPRNIGTLGTDNPDYLALVTYIQEINNNEVVFEWDSTDYPQFMDGAITIDGYGQNVNTGGSNNTNDYMHMNSIFIDPKDGNIIISLRHQSSVVKISRETGDIIWTLGGLLDDFNLSDEQQFSYQHTATYLSDGSLMVFNNGDAKEKSTVMRFFLDEENHTVTDFIEYDFGSRFSAACGSAYQMDENHILVGWGYKTQGLIAGSIINMETGLVENEFKTDRVVYGYRFHYSN